MPSTVPASSQLVPPLLLQRRAARYRVYKSSLQDKARLHKDEKLLFKMAETIFSYLTSTQISQLTSQGSGTTRLSTTKKIEKPNDPNFVRDVDQWLVKADKLKKENEQSLNENGAKVEAIIEIETKGKGKRKPTGKARSEGIEDQAKKHKPKLKCRK